MKRIAALPICCLACCVAQGAQAGDNLPTFREGSTLRLHKTRVVCQLTGEMNQRLKKPTLSRTASQYGVKATDLGSSFEHKGRLGFLFGDTKRGETKNVDCLAWSDSTDPNELIVKFPTDDDGLFHPLIVPGIDQGAMHVPSNGVSTGDDIFIIHTTDWYHPENDIDPRGNMERSVVARSRDDGQTWERLYDLSVANDHSMTDARFINVALAKRDNTILIWGSGAYRKSNPSLARVPKDEFANKSAIRYFAGLDDDGRPQWSGKESDAAALFDDPFLGELSTTWVEELGVWVMLYNSRKIPRGVRLRTAKHPWGPWSEPNVVLGVEQMRANGWVGAYGPYLISRFTQATDGRCRLYYTVSSWKPYQVFLVCSEIATGEFRP